MSSPIGLRKGWESRHGKVGEEGNGATTALTIFKWRKIYNLLFVCTYLYFDAFVCFVFNAPLRTFTFYPVHCHERCQKTWSWINLRLYFTEYDSSSLWIHSNKTKKKDWREKDIEGKTVWRRGVHREITTMESNILLSCNSQCFIYFFSFAIEK